MGGAEHWSVWCSASRRNLSSTGRRLTSLTLAIKIPPVSRNKPEDQYPLLWSHSYRANTTQPRVGSPLGRLVNQTLYRDIDKAWRNKIIKSEWFWKIKWGYNTFSSISLFFRVLEETNFLTCSKPFRKSHVILSVANTLKHITFKKHMC